VNGAYWHLLFDCFPPIFGIAALIVLLCGVMWRSDAVKRAAFVLVVCAALTVVATFKSGGAAAGVVKTMDGINKAAIQPHNEAADATLVIVLFSAVAALFALIRYRGARPIAGWATYVVAFLTILATFSSIYTSLLGGRIHHPETQMRAPR